MKFVVILLIVLICYIIFENFHIFKSKVNIKKDNVPDYFCSKKIAFLSDLHIRNSKFNCRMILKHLRSRKTDMIVITGDFVSRHIKNIETAEWMLSELSSIAPTYMSIGNHELDLSESLICALKKAALKYGVFILDDEYIKLAEDVFICGATAKNGCYRNQNGGYKNLADYTLSDITKALGEKSGFTLLLAHNPLFFETYVKWGADVVLCGHIHGGSIRIPFVCGLLSPERKLFPKFSSGIYTKNKTTMLVSRGIAKLRIFSPKHIIFLEISK